VTQLIAQEQEKIPEELQRRPEAEYMEEIQTRVEAEEAASHKMKTLGLIGFGLVLVVFVIILYRKRKA
jgi:hypothetical protein